MSGDRLRALVNDEVLRKAIVVDAVIGEYSIMSRAECECGATGFRLQRQLLVRACGRPFDVMETACETCGARRDFVFDIWRVCGP